MTQPLITTAEIRRQLNMDASFLQHLVQADIVCPVCNPDAEEPCFSPEDVEKLRLAGVLLDELEVNLAGVEIILRMREAMYAMRQQFDAILEEMVGDIRGWLR